MIPFIDLHAQLERIRSKVNARMDQVLDHGKFIMGPEVKELEERLCEFIGSTHCISCSNGTDALVMALMAYGVGPGDAVFTTPFTFFATAEAVSIVGATPIFVDIDEQTFNIDPQALRRAVEQTKEAGKLQCRGIIPVDLFGLPADYPQLLPIAEEHDLFVLEDAAQAFGAELDGRKCPTFGHIGTTSFFPAKPLGCYGDGGAVFTDDSDLAAVMESIRVHGKGSDKYDNVCMGLNARLDTLQAAILLEKLAIYGEEIELRQEVAGRYTELLSDVSQLSTPYIPDNSKSVYAQYSILVPERDRIQQILKDAGIPTMIYYPTPLHLSTAYKDLGHCLGNFPVSERMSCEILALPFSPYLKEKDQERICQELATAVTA